MGNGPRKRLRTTSAALATIAVGAVLAGCSTDAGADGASPTATQTVTETATASPRGGVAPSSSAPASPTSSADPGATDAGDASGATVPLCGTPDLHATALRQRGGGTAGATRFELSIFNDGDAACRMQGWPGVSFVAGDDGTQVGAAADRVQGDQERSVTLVPGGRSVTTLRISDPGAYGADCDVTQARGLRIYPPDNRQSLFVSLRRQACASDDVHLLEVAPVHPVS